MARLLTELHKQLDETKELEDQVKVLFESYQCLHIFEHSVQVAEKAKEIAEQVGIDSEVAYVGGLLHDISGVIPNHKRIEAAEEWAVPILAEEREFPMIIHQKLSKVMAQQVFKVTDQGILSAISCHTTLKKDASELDKVVFIADKIEWDQKGSPPYLTEVKTAIEYSLDQACFMYVDYLMQKRDTLRVVHPWLEAAHKDLLEVGR